MTIHDGVSLKDSNLSLALDTNDTINLLHHLLDASSNIGVNSADIRTPSVSGVNLVGGTNNSVLWCHDLQGMDFIYTPTKYSPTARYAMALAFILVMIMTVIGNAIVIIIVVTDRPLRRITSALVVSMATADILVAMCGELQNVIMLLSTDAWVLSSVLCELFTSADLYFSLSELLHIVFLAGDRYYIICYPFKYERWGQRYMILSIVLAWTVPVAFSFLPIMVHWHRAGLEEIYDCLDQLDEPICALFLNKTFSTISFILMFALPSAAMCYCYFHIYKVARSQQKRLSSVTLGAYSDAEVPCMQLKPISPVTNGNATYGNGSPDSEYDDADFIQFTPKPTFTLDSNGNTPVSTPVLSPTQPESPAPKRHTYFGRRKRSRSSNGHRLGIIREDFRAARSISIVFACYAITWFPYWVAILVMPYLGPNVIPDPLIGASLWLAYFGSALNPFVYYFSNTAVRRGIRHMFYKLRHRLGHHNHRRSNTFP